MPFKLAQLILTREAGEGDTQVGFTRLGQSMLPNSAKAEFGAKHGGGGGHRAVLGAGPSTNFGGPYPVKRGKITSFDERGCVIDFKRIGIALATEPRTSAATDTPCRSAPIVIPAKAGIQRPVQDAGTVGDRSSRRSSARWTAVVRRPDTDRYARFFFTPAM
jgi:hypothetical protein